jgi:protein gp37
VGEGSKIAWTHHTFSPWWGCEKVSPACKHCYAEAWAKRTGHAVWGSQAPRRFFSDKHWNEPLKWDRKAAAAGERHRVFCASMADVLEKRPDLEEPRRRVFELAERTPNLIWLFLTKRPENAPTMLPTAWFDQSPTNVWWGATVEDNDHAPRIDDLLAIPAEIHFLSLEPLLELVDLEPWLPGDNTESGHRLDWAIVGGESGAKARPFDVDWARSIIKQCRGYGIVPFVKQLGAKPHVEDGELDLRQWNTGEWYRCTCDRWIGTLRDRAGADPAEWPEDLRVQEFPR